MTLQDQTILEQILRDMDNDSLNCFHDSIERRIDRVNEAMQTIGQLGYDVNDLDCIVSVLLDFRTIVSRIVGT